MNQRLVTDDELERALDFLRDSAAKLGEARRQAIMTAHLVKHTKALEMQKCNDMPVSAQEREAVASEVYRKACYEEALAAGEFEKLKALREAAALKIESWRTEQSTLRSMKV